MSSHTATPVRFFVALLPPQEVQDYANGVIQELRDRHRTDAAKAPPHITLQAPFQWSMARIHELDACLGQVARQEAPIPIALSGFAAFAPRVLYINVLRTPELLRVQHHLMTLLEQNLGICDAKAKQRPFAPHITVASRNITRQTFQHAWEELQSRSVTFEFVSDRLTLLSHNGCRWQVQTEFPFP